MWNGFSLVNIENIEGEIEQDVNKERERREKEREELLPGNSKKKRREGRGQLKEKTQKGERMKGEFFIDMNTRHLSVIALKLFFSKLN